ncbi:MAG: acetolactate synthase [Mucilaginibacter sp.]|nr:acetolactate synthase [Mucilaginibacter sp.]
MKLSDYLVKFIYKQGVTHVFELSGGMIAHIIDSLFHFGKIKVMTMHHEQSASFAADAFARVKGVPGVAFASSGPGATNLITGIGSCYFDSVPAVFITGQVNQHEQRGDKAIRQLGFQETEVTAIVGPLCKKVYKVDNANDLPGILIDAFKVALSGRPGPVLIDIPMNLQRVDIPDDNIELISPEYDGETVLNNVLWKDIEDSLKAAKNPLLLVGRGVLSSNSRREFLEFAEYIQVPVITSLMAIDAIPFDHPLRVGFIGAYGNRWANIAFSESDLIIVIGSRLDIRQTGAFVDTFKNKKIYHVDIEPGEINNRITGCVPIVFNVKGFLNGANVFFKDKTPATYPTWNEKLQALKAEWPDINEIVDPNGINPNKFLHQLSKTSGRAGAYLADVGNHQMWCAQSLELYAEQFFLTCGGMGAMGYALPAAVGATVGLDKPVVCICGDGGFQLNIQELQTIKRNNLSVKIIIINNQSLGMIRQFQDSYFDGNYQSTMWGYDAPNFEKVAEAYGINAATITSDVEVDDSLEKLWSEPDRPYLLQVMISSKINAYPKIAFGKPISEMEPFSKPIEMEGT